MKISSIERPPRRVEALLQSLGADPSFVDDVIGDLAEEYRERAAWDGARPARRWYYGQALRTAPYLVRDWWRRLGLRDASLLIASLGGALFTGFVVQTALALYILPWLTFHTTGLPLPAEIHHWLTTGDMFPWVLAYVVIIRTIPSAVSGFMTRMTGRRRTFVHSTVLAGLMLVWGTSLMALSSPTIGKFVAGVLVGVVPQVLFCLVGGMVGASMRIRSYPGEGCVEA